jgi:EpsI family protein
MPMNANSTQRPVLVAAAAAAIVMLVFGLGYRVLAARLSAPANTTPVPQELLDQLPLQLGVWTGQDTPVDERVIKATDTDAHVSRRYSKGGGFESVSLWIASGVQARDLMPHRPEVCYTGAGWTLTGKRVLELPLAGDAVLPCNVMQFSRGALNAEKVLVLYYYLVDGQYCADVSLLRSKAWKGSATIGYMAQVQVVTPMPLGVTLDSATKTVSDFAVESGPPIAELFDRHAQAIASAEPEEAL